MLEAFSIKFLELIDTTFALKGDVGLARIGVDNAGRVCSCATATVVQIGVQIPACIADCGFR